MDAPPRTAEQRRRDTLDRLERDIDAWVSTTDGDGGVPYLVPLSFLWDGSTLLLATSAASPTAHNLRDTGRVRIGIGPTRDVVLIDGTAQTLTPADISASLGDAFAAKTGFDPRALRGPYLYFRVTPRRLLAWREANELDGRELMRNGRWLVEPEPPRDLGG